MSKNKPNFKKLNIAYTGSALDSGEISVQELGGVLISIGNLFHSTNKEFKDGSFEIELILSQTVLNRTISLLSSKEVLSLATLMTLLGFTKGSLKGLFNLLSSSKEEELSKKRKKTILLN